MGSGNKKGKARNPYASTSKTEAKRLKKIAEQIRKNTKGKKAEGGNL